MRQRHIGPCTKCILPSLMHRVFVQEMSAHAQLSLVRFDARLGVLSLFVLRFLNLLFVPFSQVCSNVPKDMHGALPIKSSVWCSCCMCSNLSMSSLVPRSQNCLSSCFAVMPMMRLESMLSLVNLFANVDVDAPNNTSAIFANGSNFSASQFTCCCRICHLRSCPWPTQKQTNINDFVLILRR